MTESEIDKVQSGHNRCRGSGKYGRWAAEETLFEHSDTAHMTFIHLLLHITETLQFNALTHN